MYYVSLHVWDPLKKFFFKTLYWLEMCIKWVDLFLDIIVILAYDIYLILEVAEIFMEHWATFISVDLQYFKSESCQDKFSQNLSAWNDSFDSLHLSKALVVFIFWTTLGQTHSVWLNIDGMLNLIF